MEYIVPIGVGAGVALLFILAGSFQRKRELEHVQKSVLRLRQDLDIAQAKLQQTQFVDLDLSVIESKFEESVGELQLMIEQETEALSRAIEDLDERLEELERPAEESVDLEAQIEELHERIEAIECRLETAAAPRSAGAEPLRHKLGL